MLFATSIGFTQFTTGTISLTPGYTAKIDTNATTVTLTLVGPDNVWLGIGFGGTSMSSTVDMFIWNSSASKDYTPSGSYAAPLPDTTQSWTIILDNVAFGLRTVQATRPLVSADDYTFINNNASIPIIWAKGSSIIFGYHAERAVYGSVPRTQILATEDFSLNATTIYPNPAQGKFSVQTKTALDQIKVYTQTGALVETIDVKAENQTTVNIEGLATGIYLLELKNNTEKSWKKVIVE